MKIAAKLVNSIQLSLTDDSARGSYSRQGKDFDDNKLNTFTTTFNTFLSFKGSLKKNQHNDKEIPVNFLNYTDKIKKILHSIGVKLCSLHQEEKKKVSKECMVKKL